MSDEARRPLFGAVPPEIGSSSILTAGHVRYYWFLAYHSGYPYAGDSLWWSDDKAAKNCNCSPQTIRRWKLDFEKLGLITRANNGHRALVMNEITREIAERLRPDTSRFALTDEQDFAHRRAEVCSLVSKEALMGEHRNKRNNKLNNKRNNIVASAKPRRGSVRDALASSRVKTDALKRKQKDRDRHLKRNQFDRIKERERENARLENWGGPRFYRFLQHLCAMHNVPIRDGVISERSVPGRYTAEMRRILELLKKRGISRQEFKDAVEYLVGGWHKGLGRHISNEGISVYDLRHKMPTIMKLYRERGRVEEPGNKIPSTTFIDFD